jgi:hypothetical protein
VRSSIWRIFFRISRGIIGIADCRLPIADYEAGGNEMPLAGAARHGKLSL